MAEGGSGFGRNFSRDVEAVLGAVQVGAQLGYATLYPHEIRENLRIAGMRLDRNLELPQFDDPFNLPDTYEPDFGEPVTDDEIDGEEAVNE